MKFFLAFLHFGLAAAAKVAQVAHPDLNNIKVDSPLGSKIMSSARKLEEAIDFGWVADFSIKFQGCHHVSQWNDNAEGDEDVRIETKRLIRFRLCPTSSCSPTSASGCTSGYGDYIIDMNTFLAYYYDAVANYNQYRCEALQNTCNCGDDDGKGDDYDADKCLYDCYVSNGVEDICADGNPYNDDQQQQDEKFDLADYVECQEAKFENKNNRNRRLDQQVQYYMGPYCSEQGGSIFLGLFSDNTCTTFADSNGGATTYSTLSGGTALPYAQQSIITLDCISCKEPQEYNEDGNDAEDDDQVIEFCEEIYSTAGKCETGLQATGVVSSANENACNYIAGIKVVRKDGIITQVGSKANKTASIFIGIFVVAFVLLAAYVYYLKTKLDRASINLSE
jgi:hypothetical protein